MAAPIVGRNTLIMVDQSTTAGTSPPTPIVNAKTFSLDGTRDKFDATVFGATSKATLVGLPSLGQEISYLAAGVVLADQRRALMLFAFGKMLGWWDILDPQTMLGMPRDTPLGRMLAGTGMVSIMGYRV